MALGDPYPELVQTRSGATFTLDTVAVEPAADIAVLGERDSQEFPEQCAAFREWSQATEPVPVSAQVLDVLGPLPVHLLTHKGKWVTGKVTRYCFPGSLPGGKVSLEMDRPIQPGTSGGPVVDETGKLVGVVSWASGRAAGEGRTGMIPVAHLALPRWVWGQIDAAQNVGD
jgi:S1-C subfamily serine protease